MKAGEKGETGRQLDAYSILHISCPEDPDTMKYIDREAGIIYINTAAKPDAKIIRLI